VGFVSSHLSRLFLQVMQPGQCQYQIQYECSEACCEWPYCDAGQQIHAPLRLLLCFRLATPVSAAFGAFLGAGRAIFLTGVGILGPCSDALRAKEGGERVTVSAMSRWEVRYVGAPAWRDSAASGGSGLMAGRAGQSLKLSDGCGEMVLSKVESSWGCGGLT
jgi:hypothetical protein